MFLNSDKFRGIATLAAAGSNQGNAASLTAKATKLTGSNGTVGAVLPTVAGEVFFVVNGGSSAALIYPASGGTINGGASNASYSLAGNKNAFLCATAADTWFVVGG